MSTRRIRGALAGASARSGYPFTLGVASGDPTPDGVVLWTRLAPRPLEPGGGLSPEAIQVEWQVAEDEGMKRVIRQGTAVARPEWAHAVHVEVDGLRPDRWYCYRFRAGGEISPLGRTRTMPAPGSVPARLRFATASCQKYESGFYNAYEHMAREDLDLIVHLGDYIYEKGIDAGDLRGPILPQAYTLDDYRIRYALYKSDPALQAAHAMAPWIVTWDDHEVNNNYANEIAENPEQQPPAKFLRRRAAAYQAYFEHQPLRRTALPHGPDMLLYRQLEFGRLASFHVLDTRQYRTDQPQDDGTKPFDPVLLDPEGTIMGAKQRAWLDKSLDRSPATWNLIAQQVLMAGVDFESGPDTSFSMDKWTGYEFERRRLIRRFRDRPIKNPVVLSGDIHCNWANELVPDFDRPDAGPVAVEFVGTSISSGGNGAETRKNTASILAENPFVKFFNDERGYLFTELTPDTCRTDYRTVPYVTRRGAPLHTRASFVVESGHPRLHRA